MSFSPKTPEELRRQRTELNFRLKHGQEGLDQLMQYANEFEYLEVVADHFGLTRSRISQILEVLLGMPYHVWLAQHGVARKKVSNEGRT